MDEKGLQSPQVLEGVVKVTWNTSPHAEPFIQQDNGTMQALRLIVSEKEGVRVRVIVEEEGNMSSDTSCPQCAAHNSLRFVSKNGVVTCLSCGGAFDLAIRVLGIKARAGR